MKFDDGLDRFDRMLLGTVPPAQPDETSPQTGRSERSCGAKARAGELAGSGSTSAPTAPRAAGALVETRRASMPPRVVATPPYITSTRGPRFVDYTPCPMCGHERIGIEYHGQLMSGAKVHQLAAHTAGMARVAPRQPRCLGAGMRLVFTASGWEGARAS